MDTRDDKPRGLSESEIPNPRWPNPAPRGPFRMVQRLGSSTHFRFDASGTDYIVIDGEPLTDILNRAYAVGRIAALQQVEADAVELAKGALEELAREAEARRRAK